MIHDKREQRLVEARRPVRYPAAMGTPLGDDLLVAGYDAIEKSKDSGRFPFNDYQRQRMNRAWAMRLAPTDAEVAMEQILAESEWWFYVQEPLGRWIVDFYCDSLFLVIEVDGGYHRNPTQRAYDNKRDAILSECGFTVLRFWNEELDDPASVAAEILSWCRALAQREDAA